MSPHKRGLYWDPRLREIDKLILRALKCQYIKSPALIASEIKKDRRYVANRLIYLTKLGLVEKVARGLYKRKEGEKETGLNLVWRW